MRLRSWQAARGFWQAPSSSTGSGTTPTTLSGGIYFVANQQTAQIAAFTIVSGKQTPVTGSPYTLPGSAAPYSLAVSPNHGFLYVGTSAGIYVYSISSSGALTLGNNSSAISGDIATTMQVDTTGNWLVEAGPTQQALFAIPISPATGAETSTTEQEVGLPAATIQQLALSPNDSSSCATCYVFVALGASGTEIVQFVPTNANPFGGTGNIPVSNSAGAALSVGVDPSNRLLYVGETAATTGTNTGGVSVFTIGSNIKEIAGSPYASGGPRPLLHPLQSQWRLRLRGQPHGRRQFHRQRERVSITATGTAYSLQFPRLHRCRRHDSRLGGRLDRQLPARSQLRRQPRPRCLHLQFDWRADRRHYRRHRNRSRQAIAIAAVP